MRTLSLSCLFRPPALWLVVGLAALFLTACSQVDISDPAGLAGLTGHEDICGLPAVSSSTNFFLLLAAGVLTGLSHCVGMCGPLVTTFTMRRCTVGGNGVNTLVTYQMGRLTTYMLFGVIMGAVGSLVRVNSLSNSWQGNLSIILGGFMLLAGLSLFGVLPWLRWLESARFARRVGGWMRTLLHAEHPLAPFGLGFANGLLPCGPVYALALIAATSGDPFRGALIMLAFGLGTLPAMVGVGLVTSRLTLRWRSHLFRFAAILVMVVGVQLILRGLAVSGLVPHTSVAGVSLW